MKTFKALALSVFKPRALAADMSGYRIVVQFGWVFIVIRWSYYSLVSLLRDYHGRWAPFVPAPFDLDVDTYATLQRALSLPFGIVLMLTLCAVLTAYLWMIHRKAPPATVLNVLGATFFLPFVIVQPIDQLMMALLGWKIVPVTILHTAVLFWESWAAVQLISSKNGMTVVERMGGAVILSLVWILVAGALWR
jgi:hypothetical protein